MRRIREQLAATVVAVVATVGVAGCPTVEAPPCVISDAPPAPERVVVADCAGFVDVAQLPRPPPCLPSEPPVASLCPAGGPGPEGTVESQAALEAYAGCTSIEGSLTISGSVCSLAPLASLSRVDGSLTLGGGEGAPDVGFVMVDLDGLGALQSIGRSLTIRGLPALASLDGLDALHDVGVDIELFNLPALRLLRGPDSLVEVGGDVSVGFDEALVVVEGFDGLSSIGTDGTIRAFSGLRFVHNDALACVGGFASLVEAKEIELDGAAVQVAPGLTTLLLARGPTLKLIDTPQFDLLTLPALEHLDGLLLARVPTIDLRAFTGLQSLGTLSIFGSPLESLGGLNDLTSLGSIDLQENPALGDVSALNQVASLGQLHVTGDVSYDLSCAFAGVSAIDDVVIERATFTTLPWPRTLKQVDNLAIVDNEDLSDLGDVVFTLGDAVIANNATLTNDEAIAWLAQQTVTGIGKYGNNAGVAVDPCPWRDDGVCDFFCVEDSVADCPPIED